MYPHRSFLITTLLALTINSLANPFPISAQTVNLGIMGDSVTDEYQADDNRGGTYHAYTFNWAELMVKYRSVNLGPWSDTSRGTPRRKGYEYNWARSGATSKSLIDTGQHTGLAAQAQQGLVDYAVLYIGVNDFTYNNSNGLFVPIYNGTLSGSALTQELNQITNNIKLAANTVKTAKPDIKLLVNSINDRSKTPYAIKNYPNATQRQRVTDTIATVNNNLKTYCAANGCTFLNLNTLGDDLLAHVTNGNYYVCDEGINLLTPSNEPHHFMLSDDEHAGTVMAGIMANYIMQAMNTSLGTNLQLFSDAEILEHAGISSASCDTPLPSPTSNTNSNDLDHDGDVDYLDLRQLLIKPFTIFSFNSLLKAI